MDETFLININCSSILFDSQETQYTMFIETSKISIVYELVEWIRWIFSIESCIYLTHDNSVIHELEDIRVLSKLKNFEIKPCGRPYCVHKKTYRKLLNNLKLFVNWNEVKVHKFFLEKLSRMDEKLGQEKFRTNDNLKSTDTKMNHSFIESEYVRNKNKRISPEKSCDNLLSNSSLSNNSFYTKETLTENLKSEQALVSNPSLETNCFDKKRNAKENFLINFEDNSDCCNNFSGVASRGLALSTTNCAQFSPVKSPKTSNNLGLKDQISKNFAKSNLKKKSPKFVRPFSLGEILSNIREDLKKQNAENAFEKNNPSHISTEEGNFDETNTSDNLFITKIAGDKKRQRTRKRKKPKKQDIESENLISPVSQNNFAKSFDILNSINNFKPNHIRFDEKEDLMEADPAEDELGMKNENEFVVVRNINDSEETFVTTETTKLTDVCQNFTKETVVSPLESKMENQAIEVDDKIIDINGEMLSNNFQSYKANETFRSNSFSQDLNMIQTLKEKLKSPVVVNRFY